MSYWSLACLVWSLWHPRLESASGFQQRDNAHLTWTCNCKVSAAVRLGLLFYLGWQHPEKEPSCTLPLLPAGHKPSKLESSCGPDPQGELLEFTWQDDNSVVLVPFNVAVVCILYPVLRHNSGTLHHISHLMDMWKAFGLCFHVIGLTLERPWDRPVTVLKSILAHQLWVHKPGIHLQDWHLIVLIWIALFKTMLMHKIFCLLRHSLEFLKKGFCTQSIPLF